MIFDLLENSESYYGAHKTFKKAFSFLINNDFNNWACERLELDSSLGYAIIQEYLTKETKDCSWEAHRRYIDIQYIVRGLELIEYSPLSVMKIGSYEYERDNLSMNGEGQTLELTAGSFAVFFPQDAHMPGLIKTSSSLVKKVVVKCKL